MIGELVTVLGPVLQLVEGASSVALIVLAATVVRHDRRLAVVEALVQRGDGQAPAAPIFRPAGA